MYKKIIIMLTLLLASSVGAFSQLMPVRNVPSPEIAGLGEYGTVPVGLFTGVPDISVPLHEIKVGGQTFPITASYHLSSVKPGMQEGSLGQAWSLQAGGYISRNVNKICDEKMHQDGYAPGYYANAHRLKGMTNEQFAAASRSTEFIQDSHAYYELAADEFSFSFFGYSGTFYYNENGGWTVISDQDIKVEFNPTDGEGFIKFADLRPQIKPRSWSAQSYNNRYFNKFTLITPDGCRYEFGGINATEYSISYYSRDVSDLIATTWQLSKIVTPDNRTITYTYEATDLLCDLKYAPQAKTVYNLACPHHNPTSGRNAMTGFLIMPVRLNRILTPDEDISFSYFYELFYGERFWSSALGWNEDNYYPVDIYNPTNQFSKEQFSLFMKTDLDYTTSPLLQQSIRENLQHSVLHRICIQNRRDITLGRSIYFDYTFNLRRKLALIAWRQGIHRLIPDYASALGIQYLRGYKVPVSTTPDQDPEYKFAYNTENPIPNSYTNPATDYWGYYVGTNVSFSSIPTFSLPAPNLKYAQSDVLTEVTYPTGGKNRFEYELNSYSKVVDISHTSLKNSSGKAGGLRVSAMSRHDRNGTLLDKKKYYYAADKNSPNVSSGILREAPVYEVTFTGPDDIILKLKSQSGYIAPVTNLNSPVVGYSSVIEETLDAAGQSLGYIKRRYSNYDADLDGNTHLDEPPAYCNASGESAMKPFTSRSMERGKLLSEECYNSAGKLLKRSVQHYKAVNTGTFRTAHQEALFFCSDMLGSTHTCLATLTNPYTHSYLPDRITETEYPSEGNAPGYTTERTLTYNNHRLLKEEKTLTSRGTYRTVSYTYPADYSNYQWMTNAHLLSPVVATTTAEDGKELTETREYGYQYTRAKYLPYIKSISRTFDKVNSCTDYLVQKRDEYANPIEVNIKGVSHIYIWSYEGRQLIARIENADYDKVSELLGTSPESFSSASMPNGTHYQKLENIRHKLPKAQVFIYKYTAQMQLESATSPDGQTLFYKYDYLGRLRQEYFFEKTSGLYQEQLLNVYDYHYQH